MGITTTRNTVNLDNSGVLLGVSAVATSGAADTNENTLATISVAAKAMGANGAIRIQANFSFTGSTNSKTCRIRFSGASGTQYINAGTTNASVTGFMVDVIIYNRNATNSQYGNGRGDIVGLSTRFINGPTTSAVDTTAATTIVITGQKATGGETITLESYIAELFYAA